MTEPRVDRHFIGGDLVVDLGCGDGTWIDSVRSRYARAIGFDISRDRLATRPRPIEGWDFVQADLDEGIPLPDGCADGVRANQVIEHIRNPLHFVGEVFRVLRPGGVFVATTPNIRYVRHVSRLVIGGTMPLTSDAALRTPVVWDDGHIHFFTARDLEWLARNTGFSRLGTEALINVTGRGTSVRRSLDRIRSQGFVKAFLTGNVMLVARK